MELCLKYRIICIAQYSSVFFKCGLFLGHTISLTFSGGKMTENEVFFKRIKDCSLVHFLIMIRVLEQDFNIFQNDIKILHSSTQEMYGPANMTARSWFRHYQPCVILSKFTIIDKNKFQTKQNKALHNRTLSAIHVKVPRFPEVHGLLASDIRDWIDHVQLPPVLCLCQVLGTYRLCPDFRVLSDIYFFE